MTCSAGCVSSSRRSAAGAAWTASWSRPVRCWTPPLGRSGPSCSPIPATRPGCARTNWTRCRPTPRRPSAAWPTTTGAARPPGRPSSSSRSCSGAEVLDSQFRGMKEVLQRPDPEAMQRVKDMLAELNQMLERGRPGRAHPGRLRRLHGPLRRHVPGAAARSRRAGGLAGPPGRRGAAAARLADRGAARRAGRADGADAAGRGPGRGDGPADRRAARPAAGDWTWPAGRATR